MSETTQSQPPSEQPPAPAPTPGPRLRPPGAVPRRQDEASEQQLHHADPEQPPASPTSPPSPPAEETRRPRRRADRSDSASGQRSPSPDQPTTATTSTTTSTDGGPEPGPEPAPAFVEPVQLAADIAGLILAGTEEANERFAPDTDLFIADEREAVGLARPTARVIARHMPAGMGGAGNPDLADAVSAAIVLFRYGLRQVRLYHAYRRARSAGGPDVEAETTHPQQPADPLLHPVA